MRSAVVLLVVAACSAPPPASPQPAMALVPATQAPETVPVAPPATAAEPDPKAEPGTVGAVAAKLYPAAAHAKHTVVHFWATWCEPCRKSLPKLEALAVSDPSTVVIAISVDDDRHDMEKFLRAHRFAHVTFVFDEERRDVTLWSPFRMPTTYVMDEHNVIRLVHEGWSEGDEVALGRAVTQ